MKGKIIKYIAVIGCICALVTSIGVLAYLNNLKKSDEYVPFDSQKLCKTACNVTLLDCDGKVIDEPLEVGEGKQVSLRQLNSYTYMAFVAVEDKRFFDHDGIDTKRVVGALANNVKAGKYKEGASTISQQLIKNTHLNSNKTIDRKVNEMLLAIQLEKTFSKEQILEMYLNTIYFGRSAYGIENASNTYFNKNAKDLTISESAVLAGMIKAPNNYSPDKNNEKCKQRRNLVLKLMKDQQIITDEQFTQAMDEEIIYQPAKNGNYVSYSTMAIRQASSLLNVSVDELLQNNYTIATYCQPSLQHQLEEKVTSDKTFDKNNKLANLRVVVCDIYGNVQGYYSRGEDTNGQVGSTLKPLAVYAPALNEKLITQASPVLDEPTQFGNYKPNSFGKHVGWTSVKHAVEQSLNIPAVKTLNMLSLNKSCEYLGKMSISGGSDLSLALGNTTNGINIRQLASGYTALANNGVYNQTAFVSAIYDERGTVLYSRKLSNTKVFEKESSYLMTDMLVSATANGTAKKLKSDYQIAAKTGTVGDKNGNTDALVACYTTDKIVVTWYNGHFDNSVTGATQPCKITKQILNGIYADNKPSNFVAPLDIVNVSIDENTLKTKQIISANNNGTNYAFCKNNMPIYKQNAKIYSLKCSFKKNNQIVVTMPTNEAGWQLYQVTENGEKTIQPTKGEYVVTTNNGKYYAVLTKNGQVVAKTSYLYVNC